MQEKDEHIQVDIISVPARRLRMYTFDFKRQVVEESLAPGASVSLVARRHDVNTNQVFSWRKQYQEGKLRGSRRQLTQMSPRESVGFVPVGTYQPPCNRDKAEIELPNRIKLRVAAETSEASLRRILSVLARLPC